MDTRFLLAGVALLVACFGVNAAGWSHATWVWGIPFALMLLFLGLMGEGPGAGVEHFFAAPNTEGNPSERPLSPPQDSAE